MPLLAAYGLPVASQRRAQAFQVLQQRVHALLEQRRLVPRARRPGGPHEAVYNAVIRREHPPGPEEQRACQHQHRQAKGRGQDAQIPPGLPARGRHAQHVADRPGLVDHVQARHERLAAHPAGKKRVLFTVFRPAEDLLQVVRRAAQQAVSPVIHDE